MIARTGERLSAIFRRTAPDPFVLAVLLTVVTAALALVFGTFERAPASELLDAWRSGDRGIWRFLEFAMQMCLVLVTGHALATSGPVARVIAAAARLPRHAGSAAALVGLVAAGTGLVNWGLGLIVGASLARAVGVSLEERGIRAHYPLLVAAGYTGLLVWHGGLSGSAPLVMTTASGAARILPPETLAMLGDGGIPLTQTVFSPMNVFVSAGLLVLIPAVSWLLTPASGAQAASAFGVERRGVASGPGRATTIPEWLERSPLLAWLLAIVLALAFVRFARSDGLLRLGLNEVNGAMLALGLVCHGSLASYARAVEDAARGCAGIMVQFPLYAGILGMLVASGLIGRFAEALATGGQTGVPLLTFVAAGIVNFFVPSGGGQWGIQGPIALQAGLEAGVRPGKMVMAVAYGDQLTNMLQPFWALPLLAITGAKARDIVGYTAVMMIIAGAWMVLGLLVF